MTKKKIYYTATILFENNGNYAAESGVFTTYDKAMEWIKAMAGTWKIDNELGVTISREDENRFEMWDDEIMHYVFSATIGKVYMNDPMGYIADCLRENNEKLSKKC